MDPGRRRRLGLDESKTLHLMHESAAEVTALSQALGDWRSAAIASAT